MFFIIFGSKTRYQRFEGSRSFRKQCAACRQISDMHEVQPTRYVTLFWLPIVPYKREQVILECSRCQAHFYLNDEERMHV